MKRQNHSPARSLRSLLIIPLICLSWLPGCQKRETEAVSKDEPTFSENLRDGKVLTTFYPLQFMASRIAGDLVPVECPLPADADPIHWIPNDSAIRRFQKASLILSNGAGFEQWVSRVNLPRERLVATAAGFEDEWLHYETAVEHTHGPKGSKHAHEGLDGHTWMDPQLALKQSIVVMEQLVKAFPEHGPAFRLNFRSLRQDLTILATAFERVSEMLGSEAHFASHPAYNYPAKRYGWNIKNLDLDPSALHLDEAQQESISEQNESFQARWILWENAPTPALEKELASQFGLVSIVFPTCEQPPINGDYLHTMQISLEQLEQAINASQPQ